MTRIYQWLKRLFVVDELAYDQLNDYHQLLLNQRRYNAELLSTPFIASPTFSPTNRFVVRKVENWSLGNEAEFLWPHRPSLRRPFNWRFHA